MVTPNTPSITRPPSPPRHRHHPFQDTDTTPSKTPPPPLPRHYHHTPPTHQYYPLHDTTTTPTKTQPPHTSIFPTYFLLPLLAPPPLEWVKEEGRLEWGGSPSRGGRRSPGRPGTSSLSSPGLAGHIPSSFPPLVPHSSPKMLCTKKTQPPKTILHHRIGRSGQLGGQENFLELEEGNRYRGE